MPFLGLTFAAQPRPPEVPAPDKEWETARSAALHFDALLMQIRTFGLPFIATAIGAGAALGTTVQRIDTAPWVLAGLSIGLGASLLLAFPMLAFSGARDFLQKKVLKRLYGHNAPSNGQAPNPHPAVGKRLAVGFQEYAALTAVGTSFLVWGIWIGIHQPPPFLFTGAVLVLGGLLLVPIYLLDRFYYSSLLMGAVVRAKELEGEDKQKLTGRISDEAPNWAFKTLPMLFYILPVLLLVNVGLAIIGFAAQPEPKCEVIIKTRVEDGEIRLLSEISTEVAASCLE
jgi:hypothetical protein